ncbi:MAG: chloride channel protein [Anaerolineae bacterium]|nr:chloride channel protein [Anaerolineae bacterium]
MTPFGRWLSASPLRPIARRFRDDLPGSFDRDNRRLVVQSIVVGAAVWAPVFLLRLLVHETFALVVAWLSDRPVLLLALPLLVGAGIVALIVARGRPAMIAYRDEHDHIHELIDVEGDGIERAIALYYASEPSFERALLGKEGVEVRWELPTVSLAARKFAATWATLGSGGSGGLEASVALMGESIAAAMFKPRPLLRAGAKRRWLSGPLAWWSSVETDHLQTAQLSGIAAAVATLTGAPFTSAFFAAEVMYRRRPLVEKLIYSLIATLVAYFLSSIVHVGHQALFAVDSLYLPASNWGYYGLVLLIALIVALISAVFIRLRRAADNAFHRRLPAPWPRHLIGAGLTALVAAGVVALTFGRGLIDHSGALQLVLGPGDWAIERAMAGELTLGLALVALVGKMAATATTIGSGGSAGLLIPSLYLGAMVATVVAAMTPYQPMTLIIPAMTASLVSIVNVPIAAILLPVELFSGHYLPAALLAVVVCSLLTQKTAIYRSQRQGFDNRQIAPGVAVRRVMVPAHWDRRTLVDLDLRRRFNVTVIGVLELAGEDGRAQVRLDPAISLPLSIGDTIVVLGADDDLDRLDRHIQTRVRETEANAPPGG